MEHWRTKLIESFPECRAEWENEDETIYLVFMGLNARCQEAHERGDQMVLRRIYDFAAWCARQNEKDLWNAAGVSFYEHIVDHPIALQEISHIGYRQMFFTIFHRCFNGGWETKRFLNWPRDTEKKE